MKAAKLFCVAMAALLSPAAAQISPSSRILIVTGGHDYDINAFDAMWKSFGGNVTVKPLAKGHEVFEDVSGWNYDILVFYNHQNPGNSLTDRHKANFRALLDRGVGMFVLHHGVAAYPHFPEYEAMAGCKYRSSAYYSDNLSIAKIPASIKVLTAKAGHPLAAGVSATYTVSDEMYLKMTFAADNDVVFRTDFTDAEGPIAWSRKAGNSRVFTTFLGHGSSIFSHADFRRMVKNGLDHILPCVAGDARAVCASPTALADPAAPPLLRAARAGGNADRYGITVNGAFFGGENPGVLFSADGRMLRLRALPR